MSRICLYAHPDGTYSVSVEMMWWPGLYDSREAALCAVDHSPFVLERLWESREHWQYDANGERVAGSRAPITRADLEAL